MPKISEKTKQKTRGRGTGANYKPWILTRELNSTGTTAEIIDWKHGRAVQLLSDGEKMLYYILRWNDEVEDIREQFPLDLDDTILIAEKLHVRHPMDKGEYVHLTTDQLVTMEDGTFRAYSLKNSRKDVDPALCKTESDIAKAKRSVEKLAIEKCYWQEKGVRWRLVFKDELNRTLAENIRRVVQYYDTKKVHDDISKVKYLIANKIVKVDLSKELLDFSSMANQVLRSENDTDE